MSLSCSFQKKSKARIRISIISFPSSPSIRSRIPIPISMRSSRLIPDKSPERKPVMDSRGLAGQSVSLRQCSQLSSMLAVVRPARNAQTRRGCSCSRSPAYCGRLSFAYFSSSSRCIRSSCSRSAVPAVAFVSYMYVKTSHLDCIGACCAPCGCTCRFSGGAAALLTSRKASAVLFYAFHQRRYRHGSEKRIHLFRFSSRSSGLRDRSSARPGCPWRRLPVRKVLQAPAWQLLSVFPAFCKFGRRCIDTVGMLSTAFAAARKPFCYTCYPLERDSGSESSVFTFSRKSPSICGAPPFDLCASNYARRRFPHFAGHSVSCYHSEYLLAFFPARHAQQFVGLLGRKPCKLLFKPSISPMSERVFCSSAPTAADIFDISS